MRVPTRHHAGIAIRVHGKHAAKSLGETTRADETRLALAAARAWAGVAQSGPVRPERPGLTSGLTARGARCGARCGTTARTPLRSALASRAAAVTHEAVGRHHPYCLVAAVPARRGRTSCRTESNWPLRHLASDRRRPDSGPATGVRLRVDTATPHMPRTNTRVRKKKYPHGHPHVCGWRCVRRCGETLEVQYGFEYVYNVTREKVLSTISRSVPHESRSRVARHDRIGHKHDNGRNGFAFIVRFRFDYSLTASRLRFSRSLLKVETRVRSGVASSSRTRGHRGPKEKHRSGVCTWKAHGLYT